MTRNSGARLRRIEARSAQKTGFENLTDKELCAVILNSVAEFHGEDSELYRLTKQALATDDLKTLDLIIALDAVVVAMKEGGLAFDQAIESARRFSAEYDFRATVDEIRSGAIEYLGAELGLTDAKWSA
jgi:hypothetical protein